MEPLIASLKPIRKTIAAGHEMAHEDKQGMHPREIAVVIIAVDRLLLLTGVEPRDAAAFTELIFDHPVRPGSRSIGGTESHSSRRPESMIGNIPHQSAA